MKYDIIVIGSGPGGYVAAIRAAQLGKKVAVVERAEAGGVCLNWGCIPTKALLKSAQVYNYCKSAEHYGLDFAGEVRPNLEKIVARSRGVAETMNKGVLFLLKKNNVELINGFAKLKGNGRIDVDGTEYEADHIILATGARPREMPFMPIDGEHVISSKQALVLPKLPETMIVVGSGAIGSEFAWFYAALGVKVTVVEYMPRMMPLEDEEVSKTMERAFRKLRAAVLTSTTVKSVRVNAEGRCEVEIEGKKGAETLTADIVLSAVGIKSNIENIGLENHDRNMEAFCVILDHLAVLRAVSRIHHQEFYIKRKLVVQFQLLKQFCHQHRIFSTGDTDCNAVSFFNQFILIDGFCKFAPDAFTELFTDGKFHILADVYLFLLLHRIQKPCNISQICPVAKGFRRKMLQYKSRKCWSVSADYSSIP